MSKKNIFWKIYDKIETFYYNVTIGVWNIFNWLPVIWGDREWEFNYFFDQILLHKLKRIVRYYHGDPNEPKEVKICINLINRWYELDEMYGEIPTQEIWDKQKEIRKFLYKILANKAGEWWD